MQDLKEGTYSSENDLALISLDRHGHFTVHKNLSIGEANLHETSFSQRVKAAYIH